MELSELIQSWAVSAEAFLKKFDKKIFCRFIFSEDTLNDISIPMIFIYNLDRRGRSQTEPTVLVLKISPDEGKQYRHLARAVCGALDISKFEDVVTMLTATDDRQRRDYLTLAGATCSTDEIESKRRVLFEGVNAEFGEGVMFVTEDLYADEKPKADETENTRDPA